MCKSGICDTKPATSLKRDSLVPKVLQSVYRNSCTTYRLVPNLVTYGELWPTFPGAKFFHRGYRAHFFVDAKRNLAALGVWPMETYFPNFVNFGPGSRDTMRRHAPIFR